MSEPLVLVLELDGIARPLLEELETARAKAERDCVVAAHTIAATRGLRISTAQLTEQGLEVTVVEAVAPRSRERE